MDLPYYLKENDVFIGNIDELRSIDGFLAKQLEKNKVEYLACVLIRNDSNIPIGIFGVTYGTIPDDIDQFKIKLERSLFVDKGTIQHLIQMNR